MHYLIVIIFCLVQTKVLANESFFDERQWFISGYLKLNFQVPEHKPTAIEIDDLSLFVSAKINRWLNPFIEAEIYSVPLWESGQGIRIDAANLTIERLYNDFKFDTKNTLRLGKFLAPVSRWNIIHAAPLVWTTNRPITTTYSYANYISGIKLHHEIDLLTGHSIEIYWQPYEEFLVKPLREQNRYYEMVAGAAWVLKDDLDSYYAINYQHADVKQSDETRDTLSLNAYLQHSSFEVESELLVTWVDSHQIQVHDQDWGGYVQLSVPIPLDLHVISRYEHFEFADRKSASNSFLGGLVYRPYSKLSLKVEWQQTFGVVQKNNTGLFTSVAVMF